jgi:hypothetical protein
MEEKAENPPVGDTRSKLGISATLPCDTWAGDALRDIEAALEGSSQFYYCQMCQRLIKFLAERMWRSFRKRPGEYQLDIATIMSGGQCCLCTLISGILEKWFKGRPYAFQSTNEEGSRLHATLGTIVVSSCGDRFYLNCGDFHRVLSIEDTAGSDFKYSSYDHFVTESTNSDECWSLANKWLDYCRSGHDCIYVSSDTPLPTRLIKINATLNAFRPRLVESSSLPRTVEYCTLSHCWGDGDFLQLLRSNYDAFHRSIPYELLSRTFKDAIYAAQRMGFEYIWIDSLCIIQHDEEDWSKEAGAMDKVYAGSSLSLAATSGKDGQSGLFSYRNPRAVVPCISRSLEFNVNDFLIYQGMLWDDAVGKSPLSRRAWIVQELFLAPRTLHFGSNQLLWECAAGSACESLPWDPSLGKNCLPCTPSYSRGRGIGLQRAWCTVLESYSTALLSFESDKFVALSGVAKYLSEKGLGTYVAGLWRHNLELQLLWQTEFRRCGSLPSRYRAPSWSWAAIDGTTIIPYEGIEELYFQEFEMVYDTFIRVLDIYIKPKVEGDVFGQINYASLRIQCPQLKTLPTLERNHRGEIRELFDGREMIHAYLDAVETEESLPGEVFLLHIMEFGGVGVDGPYLVGLTGLILRPSELGPNYYERIGRFWIDGYPSPRLCRDEDEEDEERHMDNNEEEDNSEGYIDDMDSEDEGHDGDEEVKEDDEDQEDLCDQFGRNGRRGERGGFEARNLSFLDLA